MELTPEQINEFLANAVLKSNIGKAVEDAVAKQIAALTKAYDNPFDAVIRSEVSKLITQEITDKYRDVLRERIEKSIAEVMTDEILGRIINAAMERFQRGY